ncbi:MAG: low specificity L-threonine aldolase [Methylobacteriaceae bacterium]|nr:low specificity L-threonine aldolase [Methylobacteriaceae bacterium]
MQRPVLDFRSDNVGTAAPEMLDALRQANLGSASSYGVDDLTLDVQKRYAELFEAEVRVFAVPTGTAANAACLAALSPPWGAIFCHATAHAHTSECAATEFFSGGAKIVPVPGQDGRIALAAFKDALEAAGTGLAHRAQPAALSLTQATEWGTVYGESELGALCDVARTRGLRVHMDGSRFANAVAALGRPPADLTWRLGVDILSFGLTKNGGLMCDAIVVFRKDLFEPLRYRLRRSGYVWSKMRFASAQLLAYVADGFWLRTARHANAMASRLAQGLRAIPGLKFVAPVEANEIFLEPPPHLLSSLRDSGVLTLSLSRGITRLVCRYDTSEVEVDQCIATFEALAASETSAGAAPYSAAG